MQETPNDEGSISGSGRSPIFFPCSEVVSGVVTVEVRPMAGSELCELSHFGPQTGTERHGRGPFGPGHSSG